MFGAVSNRDLEEIDKYFQQLIEFYLTKRVNLNM